MGVFFCLRVVRRSLALVQHIGWLSVFGVCGLMRLSLLGGIAGRVGVLCLKLVRLSLAVVQRAEWVCVMFTGWWVGLVTRHCVSGTYNLVTVFTFWLATLLPFAAFSTMDDGSSVERMITRWRSGIPSRRHACRLCPATLTECIRYRFVLPLNMIFLLELYVSQLFHLSSSPWFRGQTLTAFNNKINVRETVQVTPLRRNLASSP